MARTRSALLAACRAAPPANVGPADFVELVLRANKQTNTKTQQQQKTQTNKQTQTHNNAQHNNKNASQTQIVLVALNRATAGALLSCGAVQHEGNAARPVSRILQNAACALFCL